eukprot:Selendium_serpulae@DN1525_c1_g1_i1.p1
MRGNHDPHNPSSHETINLEDDIYNEGDNVEKNKKGEKDLWESSLPSEEEADEPELGATLSSVLETLMTLICSSRCSLVILGYQTLFDLLSDAHIRRVPMPTMIPEQQNFGNRFQRRLSSSAKVEEIWDLTVLESIIDSKADSAESFGKRENLKNGCNDDFVGRDLRKTGSSKNEERQLAEIQCTGTAVPNGGTFSESCFSKIRDSSLSAHSSSTRTGLTAITTDRPTGAPIHPTIHSTTPTDPNTP